MSEREEYLRSILAHLEREYRQRAAPLIEELSRIEAAKPVVITMRLEDIDVRVLDAIQNKVATHD